MERELGLSFACREQAIRELRGCREVGERHCHGSWQRWELLTHPKFQVGLLGKWLLVLVYVGCTKRGMQKACTINPRNQGGNTG